MSEIHPDEWSFAVNSRQVAQNIDPKDGLRLGLAGLWRPYGFTGRTVFSPGLTALNESGVKCDISLAYFRLVKVGDPDLLSLIKRHSLPQGILAIQHRKGGQSDREGNYRVLDVGPDAELRFGEHPDHPGEHGFYIGAQQLGRVALNLDPETFEPTEPSFKYFPFPQLTIEDMRQF